MNLAMEGMKEYSESQQSESVLFLDSKHAELGSNARRALV